MEYNKNTINLSYLNIVIQILKDSKIPYSVSKLDNIRGQGVHDENRYLYLRKIEFADSIFAEQLIRHVDLDVDDYVVVREFSKKDFPKDFKTEIIYD